MTHLLDGTITFEYKFDGLMDDDNPMDGNPIETLVIKSGDRTIFSGFDVSDISIVEELSNMAIALIDGEYSYSVGFYDEDYDGSILGYLKGGRILYEDGHGYCKVWHIDALQLRDSILSFLKSRADQHLTCGNLETALHKLKKNKDTLIDDYLPFSMSLKCHKDSRTITDRLRIQWGYLFFFADSAGTNIVQVLLDSAIDLLGDKDSTQVYINDDNFDLPTGQNKSEYYRNFNLFIKRSNRNPLMLHVSIVEQPWPEESILISIEEYVTAVDALVADVLARTSIEEFNEIHEDYDRQISFPEETYRKFKDSLLAYRDADKFINSPT